MPVTKSAKKALKQDIRRHSENQRVRVNLKLALDEYKKEMKETLLPSVYSAVDRAVKNNLVSKNKAARIKARLTKSATRSQPQTSPIKSSKK